MNINLIARLLAVWAALDIVASRREKGSESHDESSREEESVEVNEEKKKNTGAQNKFWIPTYPGHNPLNRKKIDITNSEIERFDSSIDESISGVIHNGTRAPRTKKHDPKEQDKDLSKLPFVLSGEDLSRNITVKDLVSLDSSLITDESWKSREEDSTEFKRNYSPFTWSKNNSDSSEEKSSSNRSDSSPSKSSSEKSEYQREKIKARGKGGVNVVYTTAKPYSQKTTLKMETKKIFDPIRKDETVKTTKKTPTKITTSSEKTETTTETVLSRDYYKKLVEDAVENTKRKLGYQKISQTSQVRRTFKPVVPDSLAIDSENSPEIFKVNMDSSGSERVKVKSEEEIHFETKHKQFSPSVPPIDIVKRHGKDKSEEKKERIKALASDLAGKPKEEQLKQNFTRSAMDERNEKQTTADFPSSCYYDAWSDILLKNRTQRKSKQRKPKTGKLLSSYERSSGDMRAWPGKQIREKAEELRKKEGKLTRKEKRKRAQKKVEKRQKEKKEVAKRKESKRFDEYRDSPGEGKEEKEGKSYYDYNFKDDYDATPKRGKGSAKKDYDYSFNENDFYDSSQKEKRKPMKKTGAGDKRDSDSDKPKRKFRMTTEGEKRHAYKEVKSYLREMDEEYGGRPGGDTYHRDRGRGGRNDRRGSRDRGRDRGWDRRGGDREKFSAGGRGRGGFNKGGGRGGYDRGRDEWEDQDRGGHWGDRRGWGRGRDDREKGRDRKRGRGDGRDGGRGGRGRGRGGRGRGGRGRGGRGGGRRS